jgi:hypothetical protein
VLHGGTDDGGLHAPLSLCGAGTWLAFHSVDNNRAEAALENADMPDEALKWSRWWHGYALQSRFAP